MRLTAAGKIVILIVAVGLAIGGWRLWQGAGGRLPLPAKIGDWAPADSPAGSGGGAAGGGTAAAGTAAAGTAAAGTAAEPKRGAGVEVQIVTSASKQDWLQEQVGKFNARNGDRWWIAPKFIETREAMHAILKGDAKPALWSPSSSIWSARLEEVSGQRGRPVLDVSDPAAHRVFMRTPLVFLTTREKAAFLRPRLGGANGWSALRDLSTRRKQVPWSAFRFSHADPLNANSGMMTLGLILTDYAPGGGRGLEQVSQSRDFIRYLKELEQSLIYDAPAEKGTSALTKAFVEDPSRYDFITTYESSALEAAAKNQNLAVIYPSPTVVSEHVVALLKGPWLSPAQTEGGAAFLQFLGTREALQDGLRYNLRPLQSGGSLSLAETLSARRGQGFQESFTAIELPPYGALNSAAYAWRMHVARKPPEGNP